MDIALSMIAEEMGISIWFIILIAVWSMAWKLIALWKSAKNNHLAWFIVMAILNTVGILPILYIFIFSDMQKSRKKKSTRKKK